MNINYGILLQKINEFIRKYYLNAFIRGSIYTLGSLLALFIIAFTSSYFLNPSVLFKTIFFYTYIAISLISIAYWMLRPLLAYLKIGPHLSHQQAALIIGKHFEHIADQLINALQLAEIAKLHPEKAQLALASIDQKIIRLKPIPFSQAIRFKENTPYLKYILIPICTILFISFINPKVFKDGAQSFLNYTTEYTPVAPFRYEILNAKLETSQGNDFLLEIKVTGTEIPNEVYIVENGFQYKLQKTGLNKFQHLFSQVQKETNFKFNASGYLSKSYTLSIRPMAQLTNLKAYLNYPKYTGKPSEWTSDVAQLHLPAGTQITWEVELENTNHIILKQNAVQHDFQTSSKVFKYTHPIKEDIQISFIPKNQYSARTDTLQAQIHVIKDEYPTISLHSKPDSISLKNIYLQGEIADDYGISTLFLTYDIQQGGKIIKSHNIPLNRGNNQNPDAYFYWLSLEELNLQPGQSIHYAVVVKDNDVINGFKATRSAVHTYSLPTFSQGNKLLSSQAELISQKIQEGITVSEQLEKEAQKLKAQLTDKSKLSYEEQKELQNHLSKQQQLAELMQEIKQLKATQNIQREELTSVQPNSKAQALETLFDQNLGIENLTKSLAPNKFKKPALERLLALYKQIEFETQLETQIQELKNIAEKQQALAQQASSTTVKETQKTLNQVFRDWQEQYVQLAEMARNLEQPKLVKAFAEEQKEINKSQDTALDMLAKGVRTEAQKQQLSASENLAELAEKLAQEADTQAQESINISIEELQKVLKNTLKASFDQEDNMLAIRKTPLNDPKFTQLVRAQRVLLESFKVTADSLNSIAKRVPQLEFSIHAELLKIQTTLEQAIFSLADRKTSEAGRSQQIALTAFNNLAVLINESIAQLKQSQQGGKGKSSVQSLQQMAQTQAALNKKIAEAKEKLEKDGNSGQSKNPQMSKELAEIAKQQQLLREALQQLQAANKQKGNPPTSNPLNEMVNDLKKTELDLVNKRLTYETLKRQNLVQMKFLDAEKALREQAQNETRTSDAGTNFPPNYIRALQQYEQDKKRILNSNLQRPLNLTPYYRTKIAEYLKKLNELP